MTKKFLYQQPAAVQLLFFLSIWFVLQLLTVSFILPFVVSITTGNDVSVAAFGEHPEAYPDATIWANMAGALTFFFLPAVLFAFLVSLKPGSYLGLTASYNKRVIPWVILVGITMVFILPDISEWLQHAGLGKWANELQKDREEMEAVYFKGHNAGNLFRNILLLALIPAVCEELFFRGIIQRFAYVLIKRRWLAIIITSILFALVHNSVYNFLPVFIASLILGWVYFSTSSLWMNILVHFIYNSTQVILIYIMASAGNQQTGSPATEIGIMLAGLALTLLALKMIERYSTPIRPEMLLPIAEDRNKE